jgi:hypothetical protein
MPNLEEARKVFVDDYKEKLKNLLEGLDEKYRPPQDRIQQIIDNSANYLSVDDLLTSQSSEGTEIRPLWNPGRDLCILAHMAIAAAILAAWVASGGTLIAGTTVAGVTVTSEVIAALIGGGGGRVIAEKFC